ncbi:MAG TPA: Fur family transcriptional regulator [Mycobacteriales bacterium]|nr:Fur family transcriptional regulator [Mycobacteriales bacterium]
MTRRPGGTAPQQRPTRQRAAVTDVLSRVDGFRTAQDLHLMLREEGASVGLTTVYRHLQALVDAGEVDVVRSDDGEAAYRRCVSGEHHHHLVCRSCGRSVEIDAPEVETWLDTVAEKHGFAEVSHSVEVFGTCSTCR